jgi:hypothetical protein
VEPERRLGGRRVATKVGVFRFLTSVLNVDSPHRVVQALPPWHR